MCVKNMESKLYANITNSLYRRVTTLNPDIYAQQQILISRNNVLRAHNRNLFPLSNTSLPLYICIYLFIYGCAGCGMMDILILI